MLLTVTAAWGAPSRTTVYIADLDGVVGVPIEEHMENVFERVGGSRDAVLVIRMDTPGGLVSSMSAIMSMIAGAKFPVVVWVAPQGARAASAGAFIVQASHVAVMAPGTNIGAAHPVVAGGGDIGDSEMSRKVMNDLKAKMRSFAEERGRNVEAAESMVSESISLTAREALSDDVIDMIASDEDELFDKLDGRIVKVGEREIQISLENREIVRIEMTPRLRALEVLSNPQIAYIAFLAGVFLIIIEMRAPGGYVMGVCGTALLLMAGYGLRVLPVNMTGLALLVGGIAAVIADLLVGGVGLLAAAGIGVMLFGGLMLFRAPGGELLRVSSGFVVGVTLAKGVLILIVAFLAYKALSLRPVSGKEGMKGERAVILPREGGALMVFIHGEYWRVEPIEPYLDLSTGDEVEVMKIESTKLYVKPVKRADGDRPQGAPK
jgi:membrane-bound serine protease (ClpP class)